MKNNKILSERVRIQTNRKINACKLCISNKMGKKDIIKIDSLFDIDLDVLGYIDPDITVNVIKDGEVVEKKHLQLPSMLNNVLKCKNPRCITTTEQELPHLFKLTDVAQETYRCIYCESKLIR